MFTTWYLYIAREESYDDDTAATVPTGHTISTTST